MSEVLKIAIQKSGRLSEKSLDIIRSCGIDFTTDSRVLRERASNFPIEFLLEGMSSMRRDFVLMW